MRLAFAVVLSLTGMQSIHASAQERPPEEPRATPLQEAQACYAGRFDRCAVAGDAYHEGEGTAVSYEMAAQLYRYGCEHRDLTSCRAAAWIAQQGHGVAQSLAEAHRLYGLACEGGLALGCYDLGTLYWTGEGVPQSRERGRAYYERACAMGHGDGCREVAYIHGRAMGVPRDLARMQELLRRACELGSEDACTEMADPVSAVARVEEEEGASEADLAGLSVARGMPEAQFQDIVRRFARDTRTAAQTALARELAAGGVRLTCAQIATIMQTSPIDSTRISLGTALWPRAVDPQNFQMLTLALQFEGSRTLLRQQTGH